MNGFRRSLTKESKLLIKQKHSQNHQTIYSIITFRHRISFHFNALIT